MSVGVNHIDLVECRKRGIKVGNTPGVTKNAVAEVAVGLTIATARKFKKGITTHHFSYPETTNVYEKNNRRCNQRPNTGGGGLPRIILLRGSVV